MRRNRLLLRIALLDLAALLLAMVLASRIVFEVPFPWEARLLPTQDIRPLLGVMLLGFLVGSWVSARMWGNGVPRPSYGRALAIVAWTALAAPALAVFAFRIYFSQRFVAYAALGMLAFALAHRAVARRMPWTERMVLITAEKKLVEDLRESPHAEVLEVYDPRSETMPDRVAEGVTVAIDLRAVLSEPMAQFVASSNLAGYRIRSLADVYEEHTGRLALVHLAEGWELVTPVQRNAAYGLAKRMLDLLLVVVTSPVVLPLVGVIWLLVRLDSRGPVLFRQPRVGRHGHVFTMYKFRTMRAGAEDEGPRFAAVDDERVTRVGRVLRKLRADELPQLWNVLKGDMSLVGPRAEQVGFVERFTRTIPFYAQRHLVRPGITGWAQVNYGYADDEADTVEKLTFDLYYVKHMSLWLDLNILGKSIWTVLSGYGAQ